MYSVELKVKRLSLAAELQIIRGEIRRQRKFQDGGRAWSLQSHMDSVVKPATRHANLAHTFLRGHRYRRAENIARTMPSMDLLIQNIRSFSTSKLPHDKEEAKKIIENWLTAN